MKTALLFLSFLTWNTWAACNFNRAGNKIPVVFFGGNKSTDTQAEAWASAAQSSSRYGAHFSFEGHSLHGASSSQAAVLAASAGDIASCVSAINSASFRGPVVIVGHSDGGWVINAIVARVNPEDRAKIRFVSLDGYAANGPAFNNVNEQCWTSYSTELQGAAPRTCGDILPAAKSLYTDEMSRCKSGSCHTLPETGCRSKWCLHFRLANADVPTSVGPSNYGSIGYNNVSPPLQYLASFLPGSSDEPGAAAGH